MVVLNAIPFETWAISLVNIIKRRWFDFMSFMDLLGIISRSTLNLFKWLSRRRTVPILL